MENYLTKQEIEEIAKNKGTVYHVNPFSIGNYKNISSLWVHKIKFYTHTENSVCDEYSYYVRDEYSLDGVNWVPWCEDTCFIGDMVRFDNNIKRTFREAYEALEYIDYLKNLGHILPEVQQHHNSVLGWARGLNQFLMNHR